MNSVPKSGQSTPAAALAEHLGRPLEWGLSYFEDVEQSWDGNRRIEAFDLSCWPPWILKSTAAYYASAYLDSVHVPLPRSLCLNFQDPIVSWLMPVKDTPSAWLDLAFRSIEQQEGMVPGSWELIVVDDGSSQVETQNTLASWERNPSIQVIHLFASVGIACALNEGWKHCRGQYVFRLDGDDYAHPERSRKQISFLERHSSISILGGGFCTFQDSSTTSLKQYRFPCHPILARWHMFFSCSLGHPTVTFRRSSFEGGPYPEGKEAEDHWCWLSLPLDCHLANLADVLCYIRRHPSSRSSKVAAALEGSSFEAILAFLRRHGYTDVLREEDVKVLWGKDNADSAEQVERVSKALDWLEKFFVTMIKSSGAAQGVSFPAEFEEDFLGLRRPAIEDYVTCQKG